VSTEPPDQCGTFDVFARSSSNGALLTAARAYTCEEDLLTEMWAEGHDCPDRAQVDRVDLCSTRLFRTVRRPRSQSPGVGRLDCHCC